MAHDNYDQFYTWNGGTLVLDPGVFAYDEPHVRMCNWTPVHATGLDRVIDPMEQRFCAKPMRMMSPKHAPMPISAASRCDTIVPGRSYCCPPYEMPKDWRVDYLPLGEENGATAQQPVVQEVGVMVEEAEQQTQDTADKLRAMIRRQPLAALTIGVLSGMLLAKMMR